MITIRFFNMVVTISSTREERLKEIDYKENSRWLTKITRTVAKMRDEDIRNCMRGVYSSSNFDLMNSASLLSMLDEDVRDRIDWYTIDTKKLKLFDVIKRKISLF